MQRPKVLVFVLAGGSGGRMELLTDQRAKPVLPYAGSYRLGEEDEGGVVRLLFVGC